MRVCLTLDGCDRSHRRGRPLFVLGPVREQPGGPPPKTPRSRRFPLYGVPDVAFTLTDSQQVTCSITLTDKRGNPARVDGVPEWLTDNSEVLALTPSADGMSCEVAAVGMLGTATVQVTADADLGAGSAPIIGTLEIEVTGGQATVIQITPGTPTEQP